MKNAVATDRIKGDLVPVNDEHNDFLYLADSAEVHRLTFNGYGKAFGTRTKIHGVKLHVALSVAKPGHTVRGKLQVVAEWNRNCVKSTVADIYHVYSHVAHRCSAAAPGRVPVDAGCM
jgi:hypothetical protein